MAYIHGTSNPNATPDQIKAYTLARAKQLGIDPAIVARAVPTEGDWLPNKRSGVIRSDGSQEPSWGPFQLDTDYLGATFIQTTNMHPSDPTTWQEQVDFSLAQIVSGGWGPWHGPAAIGITGFTGVSNPHSVDYGTVRNTPLGADIGDTVTAVADAIKRWVSNGFSYVFPVAGYSGAVEPHWGSNVSGSDIFGAVGAAILNMIHGTVLGVGHNNAGDPGGNWVLIQGDDGNQYYYAHMRDNPLVTQGQTIAEGTVIGYLDSTGNAAGGTPHLHIGIGKNIVTGTGANGGVGDGFNAVGLLNGILSGAGSSTAGGGASGNTGGVTIPGTGITIPIDVGSILQALGIVANPLSVITAGSNALGIDINALVKALQQGTANLAPSISLAITQGFNNIIAGSAKWITDSLGGYLVGSGAPILFLVVGGILVFIAVSSLAAPAAQRVVSHPAIRLVAKAAAG